uniref:TIR domain-containing protein n=1 Tax=uncultured Thiotrichaceae bacterium TaxID=298394 RepID=A0A6S6UNY3_9GAMM|nr:MAG: Unknown protein [uncultured Thiotrichaceae bacterium]
MNIRQLRGKLQARLRSFVHLMTCFTCLLVLSSCSQEPDESVSYQQAPPEASVEMMQQSAEPVLPEPTAPRPTTAPPPSARASNKTIGNILYNPPTEMTLNVSERIEVRISKEALSETGLIGTGDIIHNEIPVSEYMTVRLCCGKPEEDQPFDITPLNAEKQIVEDEGFTQWAFDVTPRRKDQQFLNLSVSAHYTYGDGEIRTKDHPVMTDIIQINVDQAQETGAWLSQHWQWLSLLLLIPLLVFYVMHRLKNKNSQPALSGNEAVFISYRRDDSSGYTLAIYEKLKAVLSDEKVFMDLDDIPHGEDFAKHIEKVLNKANTVLVMIGEGWLNASNAQGRRLDDPNDFVRLEIATALKRGIQVIPVLLKNAQMPDRDDLPEDLQDLCMRNGIRIYDDQFDASIQRLIMSIGE